MSKIPATNKPKHSCEYCKREFVRESTIERHVCEYKQRWLTKDLQGNRIGLQAWIQFHSKNAASKKQRTHEEFIRSIYYTAFVKFGNYCADVGVINVNRYVDWLLKNQIRIDTWHTDSMYTKFLIEFLRDENPNDALARSIETTMELAVTENVRGCDYLRYGNTNKICYAITTGKISPWMLYQSESGVTFLDALNESLVKMIIDYINPQLWAIKFARNKEVTQEIKGLLHAGGY